MAIFSGLGGDDAETGPPPRPVETTTGPDGSRRRTIEMENIQDERGWQRRELHEYADGTLVIAGQDLGRGVSDFWGGGMTEYEFDRTLSPAAVAELRFALGIGEAPLLEALGLRFQTTVDLENYVKTNGIQTTFWSRIGD